MLATQIGETLLRRLLPSLPDAPPDAEAMRLYLTLPYSHCFDEPTNQQPGGQGAANHSAALIYAFSRAVARLKDIPAKILGGCCQLPHARL